MIGPEKCKQGVIADALKFLTARVVGGWGGWLYWDSPKMASMNEQNFR